MKKITFVLSLALATGLYSCSSNSDDKQAEIEKQTNDILKDILNNNTSKDCENFVIKDFNTILGLNYGETKEKINEVLGQEDSANFTSNRSQFQYHFTSTKRVPVTISINPNDNKIETIFIEILGTGVNFNQDILKAEEDFSVEPCIIDLFGKKPKEILKKFGQANSDNMKESALEQGVRTLTYLTEDTFTMVTFKFYPSQDNLLSSITVNWFYEPIKTDE
jgi:hypothetical protein